MRIYYQTKYIYHIFDIFEKSLKCFFLMLVVMFSVMCTFGPKPPGLFLIHLQLGISTGFPQCGFPEWNEQTCCLQLSAIEERIWFRNATNGHLWFTWICNGFERFSFAVDYVYSGLGWFYNLWHNNSRIKFQTTPNRTNLKTKPFKTMPNPSKPQMTICCISQLSADSVLKFKRRGQHGTYLN